MSKSHVSDVSSSDREDRNPYESDSADSKNMERQASTVARWREKLKDEIATGKIFEQQAVKRERATQKAKRQWEKLAQAVSEPVQTVVWQPGIQGEQKRVSVANTTEGRLNYAVDAIAQHNADEEEKIDGDMDWLAKAIIGGEITGEIRLHLVRIHKKWNQDRQLVKNNKADMVFLLARFETKRAKVEDLERELDNQRAQLNTVRKYSQQAIRSQSKVSQRESMEVLLKRHLSVDKNQTSPVLKSYLFPTAKACDTEGSFNSRRSSEAVGSTSGETQNESDPQLMPYDVLAHKLAVTTLKNFQTRTTCQGLESKLMEWEDEASYFRAEERVSRMHENMQIIRDGMGVPGPAAKRGQLGGIYGLAFDITTGEVREVSEEVEFAVTHSRFTSPIKQYLHAELPQSLVQLQDKISQNLRRLWLLQTDGRLPHERKRGEFVQAMRLALEIIKDGIKNVMNSAWNMVVGIYHHEMHLNWDCKDKADKEVQVDEFSLPDGKGPSGTVKQIIVDLASERRDKESNHKRYEHVHITCVNRMKTVKTAFHDTHKVVIQLHDAIWHALKTVWKHRWKWTKKIHDPSHEFPLIPLLLRMPTDEESDTDSPTSARTFKSMSSKSNSDMAWNQLIDMAKRDVTILRDFAISAELSTHPSYHSHVPPATSLAINKFKAKVGKGPLSKKISAALETELTSSPKNADRPTSTSPQRSTSPPKASSPIHKATSGTRSTSPKTTTEPTQQVNPSFFSEVVAVVAAAEQQQLQQVPQQAKGLSKEDATTRALQKLASIHSGFQGYLARVPSSISHSTTADRKQQLGISASTRTYSFIDNDAVTEILDDRASHWEGDRDRKLSSIASVRSAHFEQGGRRASNVSNVEGGLTKRAPSAWSSKWSSKWSLKSRRRVLFRPKRRNSDTSITETAFTALPLCLNCYSNLCTECTSSQPPLWCAPLELRASLAETMSAASEGICGWEVATDEDSSGMLEDHRGSGEHNEDSNVKPLGVETHHPPPSSEPQLPPSQLQPHQTQKDDTLGHPTGEKRARSTTPPGGDQTTGKSGRKHAHAYSYLKSTQSHHNRITAKRSPTPKVKQGHGLGGGGSPQVRRQRQPVRMRGSTPPVFITQDENEVDDKGNIIEKEPINLQQLQDEQSLECEETIPSKQTIRTLAESKEKIFFNFVNTAHSNDQIMTGNESLEVPILPLGDGSPQKGVYELAAENLAMSKDKIVQSKEKAEQPKMTPNQRKRRQLVKKLSHAVATQPPPSPLSSSNEIKASRNPAAGQRGVETRQYATVLAASERPTPEELPTQHPSLSMSTTTASPTTVRQALSNRTMLEAEAAGGRVETPLGTSDNKSLFQPTTTQRVIL